MPVGRRFDLVPALRWLFAGRRIVTASPDLSPDRSHVPATNHGLFRMSWTAQAAVTLHHHPSGIVIVDNDWNAALARNHISRCTTGARLARSRDNNQAENNTDNAMSHGDPFLTPITFSILV